MRKTTIYLLLMLSACAQAQTDKLYPLITAADQIGLSSIQLRDPYLSPLYYNGAGLKYVHTQQRFFNPENNTLSMESKASALVGYTVNEPYSAAIMYVGGDYRWGVFYHFRLQPRLQLLAGGNINAGFGYKYNSRNINNPVNVDVATNLNLAGKLRYDAQIFNRTVRLTYAFDTPLAGCMYVPLVGASYYEMFGLGNMTDAVHFSSLHNKQGLNSEFTMDVPFNRSVLRVGLHVNNLKYQANDIIFKFQEVGFTLGWKYNFYVFSGRKNQAPKNFISTEE